MKNEQSINLTMKYLGIFLLILVFSSCKKENSFTVKGKVLDKESGIVQFNQIGEKTFDAKVCELINGEFIFTGEIELPEEFFIQYKENEKSRRGTNFYKFFVEPGSQTEIVLNVENIGKSEFSGSETGNEYYNLTQKFESKMEELFAEFEAANKAGDKEQIARIIQKGDSISNESLNYELEYIRNHPNSYISACLLYKRQFKLDIDTLQLYFDNLDRNINESKYYKRLNNYLSVQVGKPLLDFELTDLNGNVQKLSSIAKDKVVLIDFWASWCKPCREHNKRLKELYETNKTKGFEIVGVSQDRDTTQFLKAIQDDKMTWVNLLDERDENSVGKKYESTTVPFNVLIDSNGIIAYRANDYENLEVMVNQLLNNK